MFTEKLEDLLGALHIRTGSELAAALGCDRSYASRLRTGERAPRPDSRAAARLVAGLCSYAAETGRQEELCALLDCPPEPDADALFTAAGRFLFEGQSPPPPGTERARAERKARYAGDFGKRMDAVMELTGLSNARLARLANVDASIVSRYRRGLRSPGCNPTMVDWFSQILYKRILSQGRAAAAARLAGVTEEALTDPENGGELFRAWFCGTASDGTELIEGFLEDLDRLALTAGARPAPLPPAEAAGAAAQDRAERYTGPEGLRTAVLRFLCGALESRARELWLYSDQDTDWMTEDQTFTFRWASLMRACADAGMKIRVVHNIDRGLEEMVAAIRNWTPLYMTGRIESCYSTRKNGGRFSHTIFLAPGSACVWSCHAAGNPDRAVYLYDTVPENLAVYRDVYEALMEDCRPLIVMEPPGGDAGTPFAPEPGPQGVRAVLNTLALGSMPEALPRAIAARAGLDSQREAALLAEWERRRARLLAELEAGPVRECVPLPEDGTLFDGGAPIDAAAAPLAYTPEEYAEHVRALLALSERCPNYKLILLPEPAFDNISFRVFSRGVLIRHTAAPPLSFGVSHTQLHHAFAFYADCLERKYGQRQTVVRERLRRYL